MQQVLILVLTMNIHKPSTDILQYSQRHLYAIDKGTALACSADLTL